MNKRLYRLNVVPLAGLILLLVGPAVFASDSDLWSRSCDELITTATDLEQDLKTVDMVLGAAIDAGNLEKIKSYKLRKQAVKKQLESVLSVIGSKDCVRKR